MNSSRKNSSNGEDNSVFGDDSTESQHETSVRLQKSYKDLIRKLESKDMIGMSQPSLGSIGGFTANSSQYSINESNLLKVLMDEAHDLYKNVHGPHEARLDARVLKEVVVKSG